MTNHYEEGVAHVNTARRVFDLPDGSLWQRYKQIGTEHLPLQTILMMPLAANDFAWRTGLAGSVVSMISFLIASVALYLIARNFYRNEDEPYNRQLPVISFAIFALNPSALFIQATPMPEMLFMAMLVLAVYLLQQWTGEQTRKRLVIAAVAMSLATLAGYEAWLVAPFAILIVALAATGDKQAKIKSAAIFSAIAAAGPIYWLLHNWAVAGNALQFLNGAAHNSEGAGVVGPKLFAGHLLFDILWMGLAVGVIVGPYLMALAAAGFLKSIVARRRRLIEDAAALLLVLPFIFHVIGLVRGKIEIFPLTALPLVNVRYGLAHLPAIALFAPATVLIFKGRARMLALPAACAIIAAQYGYHVSGGPSKLAIYQEGYRNGVNAQAARSRAKLAAWLKANPPRPMVLMSVSELGAAVPQSKLNFSAIISETTAGWDQIGDSLPPRVQMVIVSKDDPLDRMFTGKPALALELSKDFQEEFSAGEIKVFRRR